MKKLLPPLLLLLVTSCKEKTSTLFTSLPASETGIHFNNQVTENDSINPIDMEFLYNGGGVAVGDFNNDSLPDIYFTGNQVPNELYLNKGRMSFENITASAGVNGEGRWANAASVVDINNDGWLDIYICNSIRRKGSERANLLYINQGKQGKPVFREMAAAYNLADTGMSVHAAFFDYDNDGDLDMYLVNTKLAQRQGARFDGGSTENKSPLKDKLFRNDGIDAIKGHPVYSDVSDQAGIMDDGYGLGVAIADLNNDGWKDIYVTNDFYTSDVLYINKGDGTFANKTTESFKHTSQNAMGNDIADFNNDGLADIIAVDMNPEDNYRKKKNLSANNYYLYQSMLHGELMLQYVRNTLQLNNGMVTDTSGNRIPVFSDISFLAGVAETDWSWSSLFADMDNDGLKDLLVTNGYPKDVTDHDFAFFRSNYSNLVSKKELLAEIPQIRIPNYAYRNQGNLKFENVTKSWGMDAPSFSCAAAYADLDRDGDLDYIISNINETASVFENHAREVNKANFISFRFKGDAQNRNGIGTQATVFAGGQVQTMENSPYRGYLGCMETALHFGLGKTTTVDSVLITWPGGKQQTLRNLTVNTQLTVDITKATDSVRVQNHEPAFFTDVTTETGISFRHSESDYIDFDIQRLLPHKLSEYGPAVAVADLDGNGTDDIFVGASRGNEPAYFLQQEDGRFSQHKFDIIDPKDPRLPEIMGVLLFDADGDGDQDIYLAGGSNESPENSKDYQDRIYINDGKANFTAAVGALPVNTTSKSCVKAADFDHDGDLDLFVGGRVSPGKYPDAVSSILLRNDSRPGQLRFTDVSNTAPALQNIGMVCDALWTDYDNDGWVDLVIAGEWMSLRFLHNEKGKLTDKTAGTGIEHYLGWWTSITGGDFDNDGDTDYIAGNVGQNSYYRADSLHPVSIYSYDFAKTGNPVVIPSLYLPGLTGKREEYPAHSRDDIMSQLPGMKKKFLSYKSFGEANMGALFGEDLAKANKLSANYFSSVYVENKGNGRFLIRPLPVEAQFAPLNGMVTGDFNGDAFLDLLCNGNDFGPEVANGRFDALNGLLLTGDGKGNFSPVSLEKSGIYIPGNGKALALYKGPGRDIRVIASQNKNWVKIFSLGKSLPSYGFVPVETSDTYVVFTLSNGSKRKQEFYYGHSYLSQSTNSFVVPPKAQLYEVNNTTGKHRTATFTNDLPK